MTKNFKDYNLSDEIMQSIEQLNYVSPTPVQEAVIPSLLEKNDIIVKSQTGSGKTAAFAIPLCELITWEQRQVQALVLTPTRELALQIKDATFDIGRFKRIKTSALYGRDSFQKQARELKQRTHIAVGTPGRVLDHINRKTINLNAVRYLIIDEADEMLNMGFIDQVNEIIEALPLARTTVLLSATMNGDIIRISKKYMNDPVKVEIAPDTSTVDRVEQKLFRCSQTDKMNLLRDVTMIENPDSCIIFCNTQVAVDEVKDFLNKKGYSVNKIHGGMEQDDRTFVMNKFRRKAFRYLVATDVAARGIDIDDISLVINYDIPKQAETYVHRIGRTGRIGKNGRAISFVNSASMRYVRDVERYTKKRLKFYPAPAADAVDDAKVDFREKMNTDVEVKEVSKMKVNQDIVKIHINAGRKTKMRPCDVVGTLCSIDGISSKDIGIINILDVSTFVEILNKKGPIVMKALKKKPVKGRVRKVSYVD
ncbi:MAG: DEAD/DEAH box helicase [Clostridia bacterium]